MSDQYLEAAAKAGHDEYERITPEYGYKTRTESAVEWDELSDDMREMMRRAYKAGIEAWVGDRDPLYTVEECDHAECNSTEMHHLVYEQVSGVLMSVTKGDKPRPDDEPAKLEPIPKPDDTHEIETCEGYGDYPHRKIVS